MRDSCTLPAKTVSQNMRDLFRGNVSKTAPKLKIVGDLMGYNVNIHTDVYRLQNSLTEKSKVAKILMA